MFVAVPQKIVPDHVYLLLLQEAPYSLKQILFLFHMQILFKPDGLSAETLYAPITLTVCHLLTDHVCLFTVANIRCPKGPKFCYSVQSNQTPRIVFSVTCIDQSLSLPPN